MRTRLLLLVAFALSTLATPALAHDFWLEPTHFSVAADAGAPFTLQVGHGAERQRSQVPRGRIVRFEAVGPAGAAIDLQNSLNLQGERDDGTLRLPAQGVYVVALEVDNTAISRQPAQRFNAYLQAEGLTPALRQRARASRTESDGSERYGRVAKTLVRIGGAAAAYAPRPLGLPLEIVAEQNPFDPSTTSLPVRLYYRGRPLGGALVDLINLDDDAHVVEAHVSDEDGRALFAARHEGRWLLNVVWTRPAPRGDEVDFETWFSSLTFGFDQN